MAELDDLRLQLAAATQDHTRLREELDRVNANRQDLAGELAEANDTNRTLTAEVLGLAQWWAQHPGPWRIAGRDLMRSVGEVRAGDYRRALALHLLAIEAIDPSAHGEPDAPDAEERYATRNRLILQALGMAAAAGMPSGLLADPSEPDWPLVVMELPTGQVSWHLRAHAAGWDGHTYADKSARIQRYAGQIAPAQLLAGAVPLQLAQPVDPAHSGMVRPYVLADPGAQR